jgi:hypothetical protein
MNSWRSATERTIVWTNKHRRCAKDDERETENANAFLIISNIRLISKKNLI